tara:strand:- start:124 stop:318 length:195 start_codon:yes stop_codon:yes gene_type:complete
MGMECFEQKSNADIFTNPSKAIPILLKSIMNLTKKSEFDEALKKIKALENYVKLTKEEFEDEGI